MAFCHWRFQDTALPLRSLFYSLSCSCWWSKALARRLWELNTSVKTTKIVSKVNQIWYNTEFLCTALLHNWDNIAGFLQAECSSSFPTNTVRAVKETHCYPRQSPTLLHRLLIHWLTLVFPLLVLLLYRDNRQTDTQPFNCLFSTTT